MKISNVLLILFLAAPCYGKRAAPKPAQPTQQQKAEARVIVRSMLPNLSEDVLKAFYEPLLQQAWDVYSGMYDQNKLRILIKKQFGLRVEGEPVSLPNPNNVCFMNGALQALYDIQPLINFLFAHEAIYEGNQTALNFIEVFKQMRGNAISDDMLLAAYDTINPPISITKEGRPVYRQGDPDEFIRSLLNAFRNGLENFESTGGTAKDFLPDTLFNFKTQSEGVRRAEDQYELLLAIPPDLRQTGSMFTLTTLTDRYFDEHTIIVHPPQQLVVLIKRTESVPTVIEVEVPKKEAEEKGKEKEAIKKAPASKIAAKTEKVEKEERVVYRSARIDSKISIPLRWSIKKYQDPEIKSSGMYRLNAAICHLGTGEGGHYVAYVRTPTAGWFYTNDDKEIDHKTIGEMKDLEKKGFVRENALPYILIYEAEEVEKKEAAEKEEEEASSVPKMKMPEEEKEKRGKVIIPSQLPIPSAPPSENEAPEGQPARIVEQPVVAEIEQPKKVEKPAELVPLPKDELGQLRAELEQAKIAAQGTGEAAKKAVRDIRRLNFEIKRMEEKAAKEKSLPQ